MSQQVLDVGHFSGAQVVQHRHVVISGNQRIDQMGADTIRLTGQGDRTGFLEKVQPLPFVQTVNASEGFIQIGVDSGNRRLAEVVSLAQSNGFTIEDISVTKPSLGDVFLKYTGRQLRDT